jgi:hypothetical protein
MHDERPPAEPREDLGELYGEGRLAAAVDPIDRDQDCSAKRGSSVHDAREDVHGTRPYAKIGRSA